MIPRSLRHRAPLLGLVVAWTAGSILAHSGALTVLPAACAILALVGLAAAWLPVLRPAFTPRAAALLQTGGLCLALASAGALRTHETRSRPAEWDALALPPREALLALRIERPFASREPDRSSGLARVISAPPHLRDLIGQRISFSVTWPASASVAPLRGAEFTALGLLSPLPFSPPPGGFDRFLADEGVNFAFSRARLREAPGPAGAWSRLCAAASSRLERILRAGLADNPRQADLYVAMLLGQKQVLSPEQKDWFVRSGTMHLFAVSGLHVAAIAAALNTLLGLLRLPARAIFLTGTGLLWLYVSITGSDASAVRAFWMITCLLGARQLRAPTNSLSALAASALGVLVLAPHQLFTAGFQMSYGIVAALLLYGVPLQEKWHSAWQPWANLPPASRSGLQRATEAAGRFVLAALALGLAATLVSTPATLGFFGLLAPVGFFVNLLLIPLSSLVLFAGVASLVTGLVGLAPLAILFNHAGALVLAGMEIAVATSLRVPGASWPARFDPAWLAPVSLAGVLALLAVGYSARWTSRAGGYWTPYLALGLLLLFGVAAPIAVATP
jgi:competence protein ComEC